MPGEVEGGGSASFATKPGQLRRRIEKVQSSNFELPSRLLGMSSNSRTTIHAIRQPRPQTPTPL